MINQPVVEVDVIVLFEPAVKALAYNTLFMYNTYVDAPLTDAKFNVKPDELTEVTVNVTTGIVATGNAITTIPEPPVLPNEFT